MRRFLILAFLYSQLLIIGIFWWSNSGDMLFASFGEKLIALGRLAGLLAGYSIWLQFILIGRAIWVERAFGLDKLAQIHHLNGYFSISFFLLHPLLITAGYSLSSNINFLQQFLSLLNLYPEVLQAFLAVIILSIVVISSVYLIRKRLRYEIWYFIHLLAYLAIFLSWGHQLKIGGDFLANQLFARYWLVLYLFVLINHLIFRFLRPLFLFWRHHFQVAKLVPETYNVTSVYIKGKNLKKFPIKAGQFMILRFLASGFWWQAHPFSLSQLPNKSYLRVTIKAVGDFTSQIIKLKPGTPVIIDGPYGLFTSEISKSQKILFIAGGIGITPIRSLIEEMAQQDRDLILLYGNPTRQDVVFKKELQQLQKKYNLKVFYIFSQQKGRDKLLQGRISMSMIQGLVKDLAEREVYICGSLGMIDSLKEQLIKYGFPATKIHYEKFSL